MKLTAKVLKEMIRKELKENMMGNKAGYYGGSLGMGGSQVDPEDPGYKIAKEQMEDYYYDFLGGGEGIPEQEVKNVLMNEFGSDPNIQSEEVLMSLVSDVMAGN